MKFQRIIEQVFYRPWLITPGGYAAVRKLVEGRLVRANGDDYEGMSGMMSKREPMEIDGQGIAHICIEGTLAKGISPIEACCGAWDYDWVADDLEEAMEANVRGVLLEINSPGGSCSGCSEITDLIQFLKVPIVAYSDDTACSAAYNIAVSCDKVEAPNESCLRILKHSAALIIRVCLLKIFEPLIRDCGLCDV